MNLALFDFDGTITTREMFPDFLYLAVTPRRLAFGKIVLAPLIGGYKMGLVSGTMVRAAIVKFGLTGVALSTVETHGRHFAAQTLPGVLRPEALQRLQWHRENGDTIVVVSGGLDLYLRHWCISHQLELICSSLQHANGRLTGRYDGAQCVLGEKARRVREKYDLERYSRIYAYGDTPEDRALLDLAHEKYYQWQKLPS